jgi:hypothetical protein
MCYSGDAFLTLKTRVQVGCCFLLQPQTLCPAYADVRHTTLFTEDASHPEFFGVLAFPRLQLRIHETWSLTGSLGGLDLPDKGIARRDDGNGWQVPSPGPLRSAVRLNRGGRATSHAPCLCKLSKQRKLGISFRCLAH